MNSIRKSETFRMFKSTSVKVFAVLCAIEPLFQIILMKIMIPMVQKLLEEQGEEVGELIVKNYSFWGSFFDITQGLFFSLACIIIVSLMVSSLYSAGPIKQLVSSGTKRHSIITGQMIAVYVGMLAFAVVFGLINGLVGIYLGSFGDTDVVRILVSFLGLLVSVFSQIIVPFTAVHLTGSVAIGIVVGLVIFDTVESTITLIARLAHFDAFVPYLFLQSRSRATDMSLSLQDQLISILVLTLYTIPFVVIAYRVFKKKDIK